MTVFNSPRAQKILDERAKQQAEQARLAAESDVWHRENGRRTQQVPLVLTRVPLAQPPAPEAMGNENPQATKPVQSVQPVPQVNHDAAKEAFLRFHMHAKTATERGKAFLDFARAIGLLQKDMGLTGGQAQADAIRRELCSEINMFRYSRDGEVERALAANLAVSGNSGGAT